MTTQKTGTFAIPAEVRTYAENSVDQARKAFDEFMTIARRTVTSLEEPAAGTFASPFVNREMNRQVLSFTEENVAAAFALARELVRAGTVEEVVKLQSDFLTGRMTAIGEQMQAIGKAAVAPIDVTATPVSPAAPKAEASATKAKAAKPAKAEPQAEAAPAAEAGAAGETPSA
ncbi:phasin family protein [Pseudoxanthobacter sp.]|uniref:phasin family protein n=1 Tax=Pseudoxanthobacter sp. TaxID=1925742 RepID=UPI002FE0C3D3